MADEIRATYDPNLTLYVIIFNAVGWVYDNVIALAFVAYAPANMDHYDWPLSEVFNQSGQYRLDWPGAIGAGTYTVVLFEQAGGAPDAAADVHIGDKGTTQPEIVWIETLPRVVKTVLDTIAADVVNIDGIVPNSVVPDAAGVIAAYILSDVIGTDGDTLEILSDELDVIETDTDIIDDAVSGLVKIAADVADILQDTETTIPGDITTLLTRLSAARAGYLDELGPANLPSDIDDILLDTGTTIPASLTVIDNFVDTLETSAATIQNYVDTVEDTLALIKAQTDKITTAQLTVVAPVSSEGDITIVQGDDYLAANGTNLEFTSESWTSPDLGSPVVDAMAKLRFIPKSDYDAGVQVAALEVDALITWAGSGNDAVFRVDLTAAQTTALSESTPPNDKYSYIYQLQVTTNAGYKITAALGSVYVKQEITN